MPQTKAYRPTPTNPNTAAPSAASSAVVEHTDEFLDDIDACLEENTLEVLRRFVQKGGE